MPPDAIAQEASVLDRIVAARRAAQAARREPLAALRRRAEAAPPPPPVLLRRGPGSRVAVIAEVKRRSPSAGPIRPDADAPAVAQGYAAAGAAMISVLTEGPSFGGSLQDLTDVAAAVPLPVLRKDFLLDEYDLCEARAHGAACALLIARLFDDDGALAALLQAAGALRLRALVEAHTLPEAERALRLGADLIGINHRDLRTLRIDLSASAGLRAALGPAPLLVAESGLRQAADLRLMAARGFDAVLIGEGLMRAPDPGTALAALLRAAEEEEGG
jgi:indole-3-glycerol phosphate synthase